MKYKNVSRTIVLTVFMCFSLVGFAEEADMTLKRMESIVKEMASESEGEKGRIRFVHEGVTMLLVSDPVRNRMRIIAPIVSYTDLDKVHLDAVMVSNFHLALDARYAVRDGVLYSAYIHPLRELRDDQVKSAVRQVASLARTFGTKYTSGEMAFGVKRQEKPVH